MKNGKEKKEKKEKKLKGKKAKKGKVSKDPGLQRLKEQNKKLGETFSIATSKANYVDPRLVFRFIN